jgi:hypothetical protein
MLNWLEYSPGRFHRQLPAANRSGHAKNNFDVFLNATGHQSGLAQKGTV